jgi:lipopolysaccharide export system protein LptA
MVKYNFFLKFNLLLIFILISTNPVFTEEKLQINADEQIFDINKNVLIAKGNVSLKNKEISLKANSLEFEIKKEVIKADGKIEFNLKELFLKCENLFFDSKNKYFLAKENIYCNFKREDEMEIKSKILEGYPEEKRIEAKGGVFIKSKEIEAKAQSLTYNQDEEKIVLREKVELTKGENNLTGEKITIFLKENKLKVEGNSKVRIKK